MGKIIKKFISSFLALAMTIGMIPFGSFISYAETIVGDGSQYPSTYRYEKISGKPSNGDYVIVYDNINAMTSDGSNITKTTLKFDDYGYIETNVTDGMLWTINNGTIKSKVGENKYLKRDGENTSLGNSETFTIEDNRIYSGRKLGDKYYLNLSSDANWKFTIYNNVIFNPYAKISYYKMTEVLPQVELTIKYKYSSNEIEEVVQVTKGDKVNILNQKPDDINTDDYEFEKISYNGNDTTDQEVTVNGNATIDVYYKPIQKVSFEANFYLNGTKVKTDSQSVKKGSTVNVNIPSEVSGATFVKMTVDGEQKDRATSFTVNDNMVVDYYYKSDRDPDAYLPDGDLNGPDKPEYPNQGAVRLNKSATSDIFNNTGLTRVELGVTGVPVKKGIDVVIVLDVSGSMAFDTAGNQNNIAEANRRITIAKTAAKNFVNKILADNEDGTKSNNRVSLVTFSSDGYIDGGSIMNCNLKNSDNKQAVINAINNISSSPEGGTDYDAGMQQAYDILNKNSANRNKAVLFLSDGAPENGYNKNSANRINPDVDHTISTNIKNLGATVYTVGFGIQKSTNYPNTLTKEKCIGILRDHMATQDGTSSNDKYYKNVTIASALDTAFQEIATSIKKAGTEATLTDTIGEAFELQMATPSQATDFDTSIKVLSYDLDASGNRSGEPQVLETVTFGTDGESATSSLKGSTNILSNGKINAEKFTYDIASKTFTWTIGDITSKEVVLSFAEYLTDSMSSTGVAKGDYPTNNGNAILTYNSYKDKTETQEVKSPVLPWGSASITVQYYLVNDEGKPVNSAGVVVPEGFKVIVDEKEVSINLGQNTTINASDAQYLPSGYELLNKDAYYTVNKPGQSGATQLSSNGDSADKGSTLVSGTSPYTTSIVAFGVKAKTSLTPDTIVLDYGKPITFNVLTNDSLKNIALNGIAKQEDTTVVPELNTGVSDTHNNAFSDNATDEFGTAKVENNTGDVTYTLSKYMSGIDKFYYEVAGKTTNNEGEESDFYKYSSISVIPATSVYYEDNFGINNDGTQTGGIYYNKDIVSEKVGTSQTEPQSSANESYGYDSSYENDNTDSNGSSTKITGNGSQAATFTFTGTGFDLIGRTATDTGNIMVNVYKGKTVGSTTDRISSHVINTVYSSGTLYQIPVYNWNCNDYKLKNGEYTVEIKVGNKQAFYLDAVRIYNPIDTTANTDEAKAANNAYNDAKEANAQIKEIRQSLLTEGKLNANGEGVVFVDSNDTVTTNNSADFTTYSNVGPNNEVYLAPGQSIGFNISSDNVPATIQIGAKAPNGNTKFAVYSEGVLVGGKELSTATDMYYKLDTSKVKFTDGKAYIMITNNGEEGSGIVSLTNIKLTFDNEQVNTFSLLSDEVVVSKTKAKTLELNKVEEALQITSATFDATSVKVNEESTLKVITSKDVDDILILDENDKEVAITSKTSEVYSNSDQSKIFTIKIKHTTTGTKNYKVVAKGKSGATSENNVSVSIKVTKQSILDKFISWFR